MVGADVNKCYQYTIAINDTIHLHKNKLCFSSHTNGDELMFFEHSELHDEITPNEELDKSSLQDLGFKLPGNCFIAHQYHLSLKLGHVHNNRYNLTARGTFATSEIDFKSNCADNKILTGIISIKYEHTEIYSTSIHVKDACFQPVIFNLKNGGKNVAIRIERTEESNNNDRLVLEYLKKRRLSSNSSQAVRRLYSDFRCVMKDLGVRSFKSISNIKKHIGHMLDYLNEKDKNDGPEGKRRRMSKFKQDIYKTMINMLNEGKVAMNIGSDQFLDMIKELMEEPGNKLLKSMEKQILSDLQMFKNDVYDLTQRTILNQDDQVRCEMICPAQYYTSIILSIYLIFLEAMIAFINTVEKLSNNQLLFDNNDNIQNDLPSEIASSDEHDESVPYYLWPSGHALLLSKIRTLEESLVVNNYTERLWSFLLGNNIRKQVWDERCPVRPEALLGAGFRYTGDGAIVVCDYCGLRTDVNDWTGVDEEYALGVHRGSGFNNCEFLQVFDMAHEE